MEQIGQLVTAGGGGAVVAFMIYSAVGRKWLDSHFDKLLADYRHAQARDLESMRFEISSELSRASKVHELEVKVLPEAWKLLARALRLLRIFVSPLKYANDFTVADEQISEWMKNTGYSDGSIRSLLNSQDRDVKYKELEFFKDYNAAKTALREFHDYIEENSVFLTSDIRDKFRLMDDEIWGSIVDKEMGVQYEDGEMERRSFQALREKISPIFERLENLVQKRLHLLREDAG